MLRSRIGVPLVIAIPTSIDRHSGHSRPARDMQWAMVDIPDPETPVGARGIGERPVAAGCAAVLHAIAAAIRVAGTRLVAQGGGADRLTIAETYACLLLFSTSRDRNVTTRRTDRSQMLLRSRGAGSNLR